MHQRRPTRFAPTDLIAAALDVSLGIAATAWFIVLTVRSLHGRGPGPSK